MSEPQRPEPRENWDWHTSDDQPQRPEPGTADNEPRAACAHRRVLYVELHSTEGWMTNRWECDLCRTEFFPQPKVDWLVSEARAAERTESRERMRLLEAVAAAAARSFRTYDTASDGTQTRITPTEANSRRLDVVYALAAFRALAADPPAPVPNPDPALAYAPDGSVVGRVIGWATKPDGRSVPILGPAPEPEPPAQEAGG